MTPKQSRTKLYFLNRNEWRPTLAAGKDARALTLQQKAKQKHNPPFRSDKKPVIDRFYGSINCLQASFV